MNNNITAGYIMRDAERLGKPMQQIADHILKCMGIIESAKIIPVQPKRVEAFY